MANAKPKLVMFQKLIPETASIAARRPSMDAPTTILGYFSLVYSPANKTLPSGVSRNIWMYRETILSFEKLLTKITILPTT